jgi:hypothetical protein
MKVLVPAVVAAVSFVMIPNADAGVLGPGDQRFVSDAGDAVTGGTAAAVADTPGAWAGDGYLAEGARWISLEADDGRRGPAGGVTATFSETFHGVAGGALDWAVLADDTARVRLIDPQGTSTTLFDFNTGPNATCASGAIGCEAGEQGTGTVALAFAGTYEFTVDVVQDAGHGGSPFGTQYAGVVTTPVPAAGGLLAGALVGLGWWRRRVR